MTVLLSGNYACFRALSYAIRMQSVVHAESLYPAPVRGSVACPSSRPPGYMSNFFRSKPACL